MSVITSFLLSMLVIFCTSNDIINDGQTCNDTDTCHETTEYNLKNIEINKPAEMNPTSLSVIFENKSGKHAQLYWDDGKDGILQSDMKNGGTITINTFIGHKFYFTDKYSNKKLYRITIYEHIGYVTLYDEQTMRERNNEFENERQRFMKEYFQKTGKRWSNFYPRKPVTHYHYNFSDIGQIIDIESSQTKYFKCNDDDIPDDIKNRLINEETEWLLEHKIHDIDQIHPFNETKSSGGGTKEANLANVGGINVIESFYGKSDKYHITRWNETFYCRNIVNTEDNENSNVNAVEPIHFNMEVLCTEPKVARILNFISDEEINAIKNTGLYNGMKRSTVSEEALISLDRTSATVWIDRSDSKIIDNVVKRIADVIKIDEKKLFLNASAESLQLVHYFPGELYKSHVDYGTDKPHNRYITFLIYLNDVEQGGYTSFPKASRKCKNDDGYFGVKPIKGSVAWFYDLLPDGNADPLSLHFAEPPINCEKWMSNLWIWDEFFTR
mmetsp:Transcript_51205/g.62656  ORF Transcript_51205/g.62656 Transcript_51205/m.62656 type:complete len:498 (+) Transcript_51205:54-1547(+)